MPQAKVVAALVNPGNADAPAGYTKDMQQASRALGFEIQLLPIDQRP